MIKRTILSRSLQVMYSSVIPAGLLLLTQPVLAQQVSDTTSSTDAIPVQRVEITGSSIKRIQKEGALPVQVLSQEDIKRSGATSATDLIQNLPTMQGGFAASASVDGPAGGVTAAALHALPSKYTLVLLDGKRVATQGDNVNLESIPLDAVERVEILTDGASALYGSDAIAGVVNFILKKNKTDGDAYFTTQNPQHPGGKSWSAGISKGWGDLDTDGWNVLATYSHDVQSKLMASQRDFSKQGGVFNFTSGGTKYAFNSTTNNTAPANVNVSALPIGQAPLPDGSNIVSVTFNPYYTANGNCGNANAYLNNPDPTVVECRFNYAATVQDIPSSIRDSGLIKGVYKINNTTSVWASLMLSRYAMLAQYAPSANPIGVGPDPTGAVNFPTLYTNYVLPYLTANGLEITSTNSGSASLGFRTVTLGGRTDEYMTNARHFSVGFNTNVAGWDLNGSLTLSNSVLTDKAAGGYSDFNQLTDKINSGAYDPVMNTGVDSISNTLVNGAQFSKSTTNADSIKLSGQHDLFEMPGGTSILSLGGDFTHTIMQTQYDDLLLAISGFSTQPASSDFPVGGSYGAVPNYNTRNNEGLFGEWLLPVSSTLEATVSGRFDSYGKIYSGYIFDQVADANGVYNQVASGDIGKSFSKPTYKFSLRWAPSDAVMLRASYGTGFKAPSMKNIAQPLAFYGSTSGSYSCPFPGSPGCLPGSAQYDLLLGGNSSAGSDGLDAENSKQWTLGFRVEPSRELSVGADLWHVNLTKQIMDQGIAEQWAFDHASQYASLFVNPYFDQGGNITTIAYKEIPLNGGTANYQGLDWDISSRLITPIGPLATAFAGTYMLKQNYTLAGDSSVYTDLGKYGLDQQVVFRVQMHLASTLITGNFSNTLQANYKSGYYDQPYSAGDATVFQLNPDGTPGAAVDFAPRRVASYTTFDWQGNYNYSKALVFTAGIKNLFDRSPPLTIQSGGGGDQLGYDGRYADALGRSYYLTGHYHF